MIPHSGRYNLVLWLLIEAKNSLNVLQMMIFYIYMSGGVPETVTDLPKLYKNGFKGCVFRFRVEMKVGRALRTKNMT